MKLLIRTLITAASLIFISYIIPGIEIAGWVPAVITALFLIVLNAVVRPILVVLTLPVTVLTLGLFIFVINASILLFIASFVDGIHITSFWSAFFGSLFLSLITTLANKRI